MIQFSAINIGCFCLYAEDVLGIFFVTDSDIDILTEIPHDFSSFISAPEFAAVIQIARNLTTMGFSRNARFFADFNDIIA